ncbi:MAG: hypothetical protein HOP19_12980 [Acidobacteria bacterium]|nr:hypothetical protein [Acidobacteriota bacterium]
MKSKRMAVLLFIALLYLLCLSCKQPDPEIQRRAALKLTMDNLRRCLPPAEVNQAAGLSIAAIARERETETTTLRMVVYAPTQPAEFHLPIYLLSRGRWTINDTGRAYLLDEHCREHKLKGTAEVNGKTLPNDGIVKLKAGEAFEFRLNFPTFPETMQMGTLVYGSRVVPFSLLVEAR